MIDLMSEWRQVKVIWRLALGEQPSPAMLAPLKDKDVLGLAVMDVGAIENEPLRQLVLLARRHFGIRFKDETP